MLTGIASVGFSVENFTHENMAILEKNWPDICQALLETVELVDSFGFDSRTIQATNSLLPVAYYLYKKGAPRDFETSDHYLNDRKIIRGWLTPVHPQRIRTLGQLPGYFADGVTRSDSQC